MNEDDQKGSQYPQIVHIYNASGLISVSAKQLPHITGGSPGPPAVNQAGACGENSGGGIML